MMLLLPFALLIAVQGLGRSGGWHQVEDVSQVQAYVAEIQVSDLMNMNGFAVEDGCKAVVVSAQSQVVAGMNYKASIEICGQTAIIEFFVPLPVNGQAQSPTNVQIIAPPKGDL